MKSSSFADIPPSQRTSRALISSEEITIQQHIAQIALTVLDYDDAIDYYVNKLGFELLEDTPRGNGKRWVRVRPRGSACAGLLFAKAVTPEQRASVGNQTGGRVFIFLHTNDFHRDYETYRAAGVKFVGSPRDEEYGAVVVFEDLYGNLIDLIQPSTQIG